MTFRTALRHRLWQFGWDLHHYNPDFGIDAFLAHYLPDKGINLVIDVGARYGEYGQMLRSIGYPGRIVSFEPLPFHLEGLRAVASADGDWDVYPYALGSAAGDASIIVGQESDMSSFLPARSDAPALQPGIVAESTITVEVRRLDDVLPQVIASVSEPRIYLKIDTQGFDLEVMRGARTGLSQVVGMQTELSFVQLYEGQPSHLEVMAELKSAGFGLGGLFPICRTTTGAYIEADGVFMRL